MRFTAALLLGVAALLCLGGGGRAAASTDFNFPAVFNFGDSNSDTGGRVAAGFEAIFPPYGSTFFGGPAGRFCDGRLIIDFLSTPASCSLYLLRLHLVEILPLVLSTPTATTCTPECTDDCILRELRLREYNRSAA
jgi:hypothetical protein